MSTSVAPCDQPTAASFGFPTEDGCFEMSNALQEGISTEDVNAIYTNWANKGSYDEHMGKSIYKGPYLVAKAVNDDCPDKNIRILDIACGTGFVGQHLQHFGFCNVDGMDSSTGMLEQAKSKNAYKEYFCSTIGPGCPKEIPDNTYDVITIAGGFGPGHIPCEAVDEMIRIVKPGGFIYNITRVNHLLTFSEYKDKWEPYIAKKEEEKKWREISRTIYKNYFFEKDGIMYIHEVL